MVRFEIMCVMLSMGAYAAESTVSSHYPFNDFDKEIFTDQTTGKVRLMYSTTFVESILDGECKISKETFEILRASYVQRIASAVVAHQAGVDTVMDRLKKKHEEWTEEAEEFGKMTQRLPCVGSKEMGKNCWFILKACEDFKNAFNIPKTSLEKLVSMKQANDTYLLKANVPTDQSDVSLAIAQFMKLLQFSALKLEHSNEKTEIMFNKDLDIKTSVDGEIAQFLRKHKDQEHL